MAGVGALDVLGDPVRRRILELLIDGEMAAGDICADVQATFAISQPAVSQHLRVLRDNGFATVRIDGARRLYSVRAEPLREAESWLSGFRRFWEPPLAALATEVARGKRERRQRSSMSTPDTSGTDTSSTDTSGTETSTTSTRSSE
jgi:DNA-binding transcriptional ArsR family regulator